MTGFSEFWKALTGWLIKEDEMASYCKYGDPSCPCQDGMMCHYEGPDPWPLPSTARIRAWQEQKLYAKWHEAQNALDEPTATEPEPPS